MIRKISRFILFTIGTVTLCACAPQTRFEWGTYEPSLYAYYKDSGYRAKYETALVQAISVGKKSNKVAPGLNAELGYMYLEDGNLVEAQAKFDEEMRLFPESRFFLSGVVKRMSSSAGKGASS